MSETKAETAVLAAARDKSKMDATVKDAQVELDEAMIAVQSEQNVSEARQQAFREAETDLNEYQEEKKLTDEAFDKALTKASKEKNSVLDEAFDKLGESKTELIIAEQAKIDAI